MALESALQHAFVAFNIAEGALWIGIAAALARRAYRRRRDADLLIAASLLFFTFGLSDFVEIRTGGWYRPASLLAWKAFNLIGLAVVYCLYRRRSACASEDVAG